VPGGGKQVLGEGGAREARPCPPRLCAPSCGVVIIRQVHHLWFALARRGPADISGSQCPSSPPYTQSSDRC
jgi:hypothetical protein